MENFGAEMFLEERAWYQKMMSTLMHKPYVKRRKFRQNFQKIWKERKG